jgi:transposase
MSHNEFRISEALEPQEVSPMKHEMNVLGIDIAKRVSRHDLMPFIAQLPPVLIGMEACGGAHDWARRFREYGHEAKLMAPQFVKPYVKSHKNDSRDAEAIAEAVTRPTMRFVPIKDVDQQDIQALHRVRERLISERTALVHEVHGLMNEYGIVIPQGVSQCRQAVVSKLEAVKDKLSALSQEMFWTLVEEFTALEEQLAYYQEKLEVLATTHPECQRLMTIPGIGPFSATALVALSAMPAPSRTAGNLLPGWGWCRANILLEGRSACWALLNGVIAIYANSSSMERGRPCAGWASQQTGVASGSGS